VLDTLSIIYGAPQTGRVAAPIFEINVSDPGGLGLETGVLHLDNGFGGSGDDLYFRPASPGNTMYFDGHAFASPSAITVPGLHSIIGLTVTDYAGNVSDYSAARLQSMGITTSFYVASPARADFDGNGNSDILWRKADGTVSTWSASGSGASDGIRQDTFHASVDSAWRIADTFDWNGDGRADIVWRHQNGDVSIWAGQTGGFQQSAFNVSGVNTTWSIAGAGDLNGDGNGDLLWRNQDGSISSWLSTGTSFQQNAYFHASVGTSWKVEGVGDFNADGKSDILWRNDSGALAVWRSTGSGFQENSLYHDPVDRSWHVVGMADFNGDGRDDILWRNDNGAVSVWQGGATLFAESKMNAQAAVDWSVAQVGDFNGDGLGDILWRNTSGATSIWHSTGEAWQQNTFYDNSVGTDWTIATHMIPL
jgi:hypothetical protein